MQALVLTPSSRALAVHSIPIPAPGPSEVLIHVRAVALNPVDVLFVTNPIAAQEQRVIGTDFAGEVVGVGPDLNEVDDARAKVGARVAGFLQGASSVNDRPGAFAEYVTSPYDLLWTIPSSLSFEEASTVSMCGLTAAQGLFYRLQLLSPFYPSPKPLSVSPLRIFIYGATTSVGLYAAQLARLASQDVQLIGAASKAKHDFLRAVPYAYDILVDYREEGWEEEVLRATGGVDVAVDCIAEGSTVEKVHKTFGQKEGRFAVFRTPGGGGYDVETLRVKPIYGAVWEGLGVEVGYDDSSIPANPEARAFAAKFFEWLGSRGEVKLEPNPVRVMPGSLERIAEDGFKLFGTDVSGRTGSGRAEDYMRPISGEKLVYRID